jgi:hypothetical protein
MSCYPVFFYSFQDAEEVRVLVKDADETCVLMKNAREKMMTCDESGVPVRVIEPYVVLRDA